MTQALAFSLPSTHKVVLPIKSVSTIPDTHSITLPFISLVTVTTAVEFNCAEPSRSVIFSNVKGSHGEAV